MQHRLLLPCSVRWGRQIYWIPSLRNGQQDFKRVGITIYTPHFLCWWKCKGLAFKDLWMQSIRSNTCCSCTYWQSACKCWFWYGRGRGGREGGHRTDQRNLNLKGYYWAHTCPSIYSTSILIHMHFKSSFRSPSSCNRFSRSIPSRTRL